MKDHTDLLNFIARKIKAKSYLELGTFNPDHNFEKINVKGKIGVDPDPNARANVRMTSDEFFEQFSVKHDLIFIDGLHEAEQVKRDIDNAWNCLNMGGVIVLHDVNPHSERITHYPRDSGEWCGNVYLTAGNIISEGKFTVDFDYGCMVIRNPVLHRFFPFDWEYFQDNNIELLNLKTVDESIKIIESWT